MIKEEFFDEISLKDNNLDYLQENVDITELSNFKTMARARYYFEIQSRHDVDKLYEVVQFANSKNLKILFIWWGTNLLFAFDIFNWIIVKNCLQWWSYDKLSMILDAYTWEPISDIAKGLEEDFNQDMWHRFIWLPWSVWWAVFWNAWCFWLETEWNFKEAEVLNLTTWKIEIFDKASLKFSYRNSIFKMIDNYFIISVKFDLNEKVEKYSSDVDSLDFRENKQPKWNSAWSFFKNPSKELSAWKVIEEVWLKWFNHNWVLFSPLHANFLINSKRNWDWKDLIYMIDLAKIKVKDRFWIDLEPEVRIISN